MKLTRKQLRKLILEKMDASIDTDALETLPFPAPTTGEKVGDLAKELGTRTDIGKHAMEGDITGELKELTSDPAVVTMLAGIHPAIPLATKSVIAIASKYDQWKASGNNIAYLMMDTGLQDAYTVYNDLSGMTKVGGKDVFYALGRGSESLEQLVQEWYLALKILAQENKLGPAEMKQGFALDEWLDRNNQEHLASWLRQKLGIKKGFREERYDLETLEGFLAQQQRRHDASKEDRADDIAALYDKSPDILKQMGDPGGKMRKLIQKGQEPWLEEGRKMKITRKQLRRLIAEATDTARLAEAPQGLELLLPGAAPLAIASWLAGKVTELPEEVESAWNNLDPETRDALVIVGKAIRSVPEDFKDTMIDGLVSKLEGYKTEPSDFESELDVNR